MRQKHFYTLSEAEAAYVERDLGFRREGVVGYLLPTPVERFHTRPLYRAYSGAHDNHFYTGNSADIQYAESVGYHPEGVAGYIFGEFRDPLPAVEASLQSNYASGAPLSTFIVSGAGLEPNQPYT
ncbi:MAG: hypothetical protein EOM24_32330, partial [Chloroflexia bacterium]|nr:hypothetical protein [Chloroflexia bacterium]